MQITKTQVEMTTSDLMSIINQYAEIPDLNINGVYISKTISLTGVYKAGVSLPFKITVSLLDYNRDSIVVKLEKVKVVKIGVINWIKKFAMNKLMSKLNLKGIRTDGDWVIIEIKKTLDLLPFYLDLDLAGLELSENKVIVTVENIKFSLEKVKKYEDIRSSGLGQSGDVNKLIPVSVNKIEDNYTKIRKNLQEKVPSKYDKLIEYAFVLPDIIALFYRIFKDKRVPLKIKIVLGGVLGYLASPVDIMPDFMPFIGKLDDLALAFYALNKVINEVPANVILENWQGSFEALTKIQEGVKYLNKAAGGGNVDKLFKFAEKVYEFSKEDKIEGRK